MDRQPRSWKPLRRQLRAGGRLVAMLSASIVSLCLVVVGGCSWLEHSKLKQYQSENDRLIGEFRAERKRSTVLDERNEALSDRVAQLEDRLATVSDSLREESVAENRFAEPAEPSSEPQRLSAPRESWRERF